MHAPFAKLVRKAHAWLLEADRLLTGGCSDAWHQLSSQVSLLRACRPPAARSPERVRIFGVLRR